MKKIGRTNEIIRFFHIKNGQELTEFCLKSDIILRFPNSNRNQEFGINCLCFVSLPSFTMHCALEYTGISLQILQDEELILLLENNIRGGLSSIMGDRYVKSDESEKIVYIDSNNLYGCSMIQSLPYGEIKFDKDVKLEDILNTPDDSDMEYFIECDLINPDNIKEKTDSFPICPENKTSPHDKFSVCINEMRANNYKRNEKLFL